MQRGAFWEADHSLVWKGHANSSLGTLKNKGWESTNTAGENCGVLVVLHIAFSPPPLTTHTHTLCSNITVFLISTSSSMDFKAGCGGMREAHKTCQGCQQSKLYLLPGFFPNLISWQEFPGQLRASVSSFFHWSSKVQFQRWWGMEGTFFTGQHGSTCCIRCHSAKLPSVPLGLLSTERKGHLRCTSVVWGSNPSGVLQDLSQYHTEN